MAGNPNAIFSQALAVGPRQIPLSELQGQMAQTAATQQQTAESAQQTRGLAQANELRRRQLEDEQAVRDTMARHMKSVPITAPNVSLPTAGVDEDGNPLPNPPSYHQAGAAGAVQLQLPDIHGMYTDLIKQGRWPAAQTLLKTVQGIQTTDLENAKTQMANFETANNRRNELAASVVKAQQEDPASADGVARQVGLIMEQEGHLPSGAGANFGVDQANAMYRATSGAKEPIRQAKDALGLTEAQTGLAKAQEKAQTALAGKAEEETKQYKLANDAAEQFMKDPNRVLGPGGMIDQIGLTPDDAKTIKGAAMMAYQMPGTRLEQAAAVKTAIMDGMKSVLEERRTIREKTNPQIIAAEAQKGALSEIAKARLAGGPLANVPTEGLQRLAFQGQQKAEQEWHKAEGDAQRLLDSVDLARSQGNQVAAGMLPLEVLREVVPRVARQEIPMAAGGQSIARRLGNWISRGATGVPQDVTLQDMENFGKAMLESAKTVYRGNIGGINRSTKATYDTEPPVTARPAAAPEAQPAQPARQATTIPLITTKAAFDALPRGATYRERDGNTYKKP